MSKKLSQRSYATRKNRLMRAKLIQEAYREHHVQGIPAAYIWREYIYPKYFISKKCFDTYLGLNITVELQKLEQLKPEPA